MPSPTDHHADAAEDEPRDAGPDTAGAAEAETGTEAAPDEGETGTEAAPDEGDATERSGRHRTSKHDRRALQQQLDAALAVLLDSAADYHDAVVHLWRGWLALGGDERDAGRGMDVDLDALFAAAVESRPAGGDERADAEARAVLEELAAIEGGRTPPPSLSRSRLLRHARWLGEAADEPPGRRRRRLRLWSLIAVAMIVFLPAAAWLVASLWQRAGRPWYGRYYHNAAFRGDPWGIWDRDVRFDWKEAGPLEAFRQDDFTVRWDSCLVVLRSAPAVLQLTSDDGARLLVDGKVRIDDLDRVGNGTQAAEVPLAPGVHAVRVEYRERTGAAHVALTLSRAGAVPGPIPNDMLRPPPMPFDDAHPCRGVKP